MENRKQVIIVEPRGVPANVFSDYIKLPLMGTLYLATILKQAGFEVQILNENLLGRDLTLNDLQADYLLLSLLTPTAERGFELARMFKSTNLNSKVIIGGIHPSFLPEEAAQYADHVVVGEGEEVIADLLRHGSDQKIISGSRPADLDALPLPDFSLLARRDKLNITPVMTSRGCPFHCNFCAVTEMFGRRYRANSVERIMEELGQVRTKHIFFYDDNFAASPKRTHALMDRMIEKKLKFVWSAQVRADITRDGDLIAKMRRAGCSRVYIGFESINPKSLDCLQKNQTPEDVKEAIRIFQAHKIGIHGMFIFGSDGDDPSVFRNTSAFCRRHRLSSVQFLILTPIPGTAVYRQLEQENRLLHKKWSYYDGLHAVFNPLGFSPAELQEGTIQAFESFYSYLNIMNDALNAFFETGAGMATSLFSGFRVPPILTDFNIPSLQDALIKFKGKLIVKKWQLLNKDYLSYLRGIRLPGVIKNPS